MIITGVVCIKEYRQCEVLTAVIYQVKGIKLFWTNEKRT